MDVLQAEAVAAPFDAVAARYDETFTTSKIGYAQRASVWKDLERVFRAGERVVEIGCGTGVDACFMAERGMSVVACDKSPKMLDQAIRRITKNGRHCSVQPQLLAAADITSLPGRSFDGAFSNFGALNCVEDLHQFARDLALLLKPGATALLCWMGPCCAWEIAWYLAHGNPAKAFRRFHRGGVTARFSESASVQVHYPSVRRLRRIFAPELRLLSFKGIGVSVPPSYMEHCANRFPRLFDWSRRADLFLGSCPGPRMFADHILLEFRRENLQV